MLKCEEISNPSSCFNKAGVYELLFVLLARDPAAPAAIRAWIEARILIGKNSRSDPQMLEAMNCAAEMENDFKVLAIQRQRIQSEIANGMRAAEGEDAATE